MRNRRLVSILSVFVLGTVITLSACSGQSKTTQSAGHTLPALNTKEHVTLTVWDISNPAPTAAFKVYAAQFHKRYPNVTVKYVPIPLAQYYAKIRAAFAAKNGPDVVAQYVGTPTLSYAYALRPMNDLVTPDLKKNLAWVDYDRQYFDPGLHTLPSGFAIYGFAYNKQLFKKAGLDPAKPPTTLAGMLSTCDKLKSAGITPWSVGAKDGWVPESILFGGLADAYWTTSARKAWFDWKTDWQKSSAVTKGLDTLTQLNKRCFESNAAATTYTDADNAFKAGKAAIEQVYGLPSTYEKNLGKGNVGFMRPPMVPGAAIPTQYLPAVPQIGYGITNYTKSCRWAWQFMSTTLFSRQGQLAAVKNQGSTVTYGGVIPNRTDIPSKQLVRSAEDADVYTWLKSPYAHYGQGSRNEEEDGQLTKLLPEVVAGTLSGRNFTKQMDSFVNTIPSQDKLSLSQRTPQGNTPVCGG